MDAKLKIPIGRIMLFVVFFFMMLVFINSRDIEILFNPNTDRTVVSNNLPLELAWSYHPGRPLRTEPIGNSRITIIRIDDDTLMALDNETGDLVWEFEAPSHILSSGNNLIINEEILVTAFGQSDRSDLFALDLLTGEEIWQIRLPAQPLSTPDIVVINDVVIAAKRSEGGFFIAGFNLIDGKQMWNSSMAFPPTGYSDMLVCSVGDFILELDENDVLCGIFHEQIFLIDPERGLILERINAPFSLSRDPIYRNDKFFVSTNDAKPVVQVFDIEHYATLSLPATCATGKFAFPVTGVNEKILVSNGCDEVYSVDEANLQASPEWIYTSPITLTSQFVSLDGSVGYVLDSFGQINGIDLGSGEIVGSITTSPDAGMRNRKQVNGLYLNPPFLYAVMDEGNLMVFREAEIP